MDKKQTEAARPVIWRGKDLTAATGGLWINGKEEEVQVSSVEYKLSETRPGENGGWTIGSWGVSRYRILCVYRRHIAVLVFKMGTVMTKLNRLIAALLFLILFAAGSVPAVAAPCTAATLDCIQWVALGTARSIVYSTYALDARNDGITRALIVVHGAGRNADTYFRTTVKAASLADALADTIIIAPRFSSNNRRSCRDTLDASEINWACTGNSWRSGGVAMGTKTITSFDLVDEILRKLARKDLFPNLKAIVLAGHSAGGQFVTRYEMANQVHDRLGVPVSYVVANPSSYAYLDSNRPVAGTREFQPPAGSASCKTYDHWPYGLKNRSGYAARLTDDQLKKQLVARPVTYMLGELDMFPLSNFDTSCPAMAQGHNRLERGRAFTDYIRQNYGAGHRFMIIPACGHSARCMFTEKTALPILFPKP
jgi:pimeloyl-ACP methyl ester carboxylesterase